MSSNHFRSYRLGYGMRRITKSYATRKSNEPTQAVTEPDQGTTQPDALAGVRAAAARSSASSLALRLNATSKRIT